MHAPCERSNVALLMRSPANAHGTVKLVLLDRPWVGPALLPEEKGGAKTLTIDTPQQKYVFEQSAKKP